MASAENYATILSKLRDEGVEFETDNGFELLPETTVEVAQYYIFKISYTIECN